MRYDAGRALVRLRKGRTSSPDGQVSDVVSGPHFSSGRWNWAEEAGAGSGWASMTSPTRIVIRW
ncbi:MAG: hypothetical protein L0I76_07670 [Pseudonocardia sp.]|nr:hypothetical protein [Pseudonocardia sp.]